MPISGSPPAGGGLLSSFNRNAPARPSLRPLSGRPPIHYVPLAARAQAAAAAPHHASRSLWNQVSDAATGIIPGVIHLAAQAGQTAAAPVRIGYDVARGNVSARDVASNLIHGGNTDPSKQNLFAKYVPLVNDVTKSVNSTIGDVRHPTRFARAVKDGRIVDKVLEDVGNLAIVAGPAAKGLTAAGRGAEASGLSGLASGFETAAKVTDRIHHIAGATADAPVALPRAGLNAVRTGFRKGVNALADGERAVAADAPGWMRGATAAGNAARTVLGGSADALRTRNSLRLTEEGIAGKAAAVEGRRLGNRAFSRTARDLFRDAGIHEKGAVVSTAEEGAAMALIGGTGQMDQLIGRNAPTLTPEQVRRTHTLRDIPEQTFTPEVAAVTRQYLDGTLAPDARARVDRHMEAANLALGKSQERALIGDGRVGGPLDPAHLGDAPLDTHMTSALKDSGLDKATLDAIDASRQKGASWDAIAQVIPEVGQVLDNPGVWPAQWRPAMRQAGLARAEGINVPLRPTDLLGAGIERPTYLPGGESSMLANRKAGLGREYTRDGLSGMKAMSSEHFRATSEIQPYSLRTLAEKLGKEARTTEFNTALAKYAQSSAIPTVAHMLDQPTLDQFHTEAVHEATAQRGTKSQIRAATDQFYGQKVIAALKDKGYEIFNGDVLEPKAGDFNPDTGIDPSHVRPDQLVLPAGVKAKLVPYVTEKNGNVGLRALAKINTKFKGAVLPFSLRWQAGDLVGGAFMSWTGGGINPIELGQAMMKRTKLTAEAQRALFDNPEFQQSGLNFQENQSLRGMADAKPPRTIIGKVARKSYQVNEAINHINRQGYLIAKTERVLKQHGLSSLDELNTNPAGWKHPDVQKAINEAVIDANKVMGTFDEMTPFEQRVMKQVFPFWAWNRHITSLAFRTAVDNPARMVWTLRIGGYGVNPDDSLPPWLKGALNVGGKLVPTNFINPFNDVAGGSPIYTPNGALKAMSPGIKLGASALLGADLNRGGLQITRPFGTGSVDELGRQSFTPGILHPAELAYQVARTFPLSRVALDAAPTGSLAGVGLGPHPRYGQGTQMVNKLTGAPIGTDSRWTKAAGLIGLPVPTDPSTASAILQGSTQRKKVTGLKRAKVRIKK